MVEPPDRTMFWDTVSMPFKPRALDSRVRYLVEATPNIDGGLLHNAIDDLGQWCEEVRRVDFWVEENLRSKKSLVSDVHRVFL